MINPSSTKFSLKLREAHPEGLHGYKDVQNTFRWSTLLRALIVCVVISVQNFLPTDLSSPFIVLAGLSIIIFGKIKIQRSYLKLVWPLLMVLIIGTMGAFGHESRHILRDIAFALTPISLILMGRWIADNRGMWPLILKIMVAFGFVLATVHLSTFILNPALLSADINEVRSTAGSGSDLVVLSFILGLFQYRLGIGNLFPKLIPRFIGILMLLTSFVLSYSRTEFLVGVILSLSLLGWLSRVNFRFVLVIAVVAISYITIAIVTPENEVGTFRSKLLRSFSEVTVSNYQDEQDINNNWRGYEAYRTIATFLTGNAQQQVFGQGFGALVDLDLYIKLGGDEEYRYIPITHNGYVYILIKTGLLGLICYALFYIGIIRYSLRYCNSMCIEERLLARLLLGCVLSLIFVMFVIGGMAEMHSSELVLLLGFLMRRIAYLHKERSRVGAMRID